MGEAACQSGKLRRPRHAYTEPLPPPSPRKLIAGRERIYSAPGARNAPGSRRRRHASHAQPGPDGRPPRSSPCFTHARRADISSVSEPVSPVCVVGRFPPLPTLCALTDSPTNPLKFRLTPQRRRFPAAFAEIGTLPKFMRTPLVCAGQRTGSRASNALQLGRVEIATQSSAHTHGEAFLTEVSNGNRTLPAR